MILEDDHLKLDETQYIAQVKIVFDFTRSYYFAFCDIN